MKRRIPGFDKLTEDEKKSLFLYFERMSFDKGLSTVEGKTVGEVIGFQKKWEMELEEFKAKFEREKAAEAAALQGSLSVIVNSKSLVGPDYDKDFRFFITYTNTSQKDIRGFQGSVVFYDLFGDRILGLDLKIFSPVKVGEKGTWEGGFRFNQFINQHVQLKNTELKDLKVVWEPEKILFINGATLPKKETFK